MLLTRSPVTWTCIKIAAHAHSSPDASGCAGGWVWSGTYVDPAGSGNAVRVGHDSWSLGGGVAEEGRHPTIAEAIAKSVETKRIRDFKDKKN